MAVPCTPPRHTRHKPHLGGLAVPALLTRSRSDNCLQLHLADDPVTHLQALLSKHRLPESTKHMSHMDGGSVSTSPLPPCILRYTDSLLPFISRSLSNVAHIFAPQSVLQSGSGPGKDVTDSFAEYLERVSERARLQTNARDVFHESIEDMDFIIRFLLRPLNELMQCMLLTTGVQVYWCLADRDGSGKPGVELIHHQEPGKVHVLAVLRVTTPKAVSDKDMATLLEYIRRGMITINYKGVVEVRPIVTFGGIKPWAAAYGLASKAIEHMLATDATYAVISNCNRFIVIQKVLQQDNPAILEFSNMVNLADVPNLHLSQSPFGLFLGLAVHALARRGVYPDQWKPGDYRPPVTLIVENLMAEHFGPNPSSKRHSHSVKARRRAMFGMGLNPSHLGAATFRLTISLPFHTLLTTRHVFPRHLLYWGAPFFGPWGDPHHLPELLPEAVTLDSPWEPQLELVEYKGRGSTWHVFCARFAWINDGPADLVLKITDVTPFKCPLGGMINPPHNPLPAVEAEMRVYTALKELQGRVVPRFLGILGSCQPTRNASQRWIALFSDAGYPLTPADGTIDVKWVSEWAHTDGRTTIRQHYAALHDAGVLHVDVGWRHILRHDDEIRLVGFKSAIMRGSEDDATWAERCSGEMAKVETMLGSALREMAANAKRKIKEELPPPAPVLTFDVFHAQHARRADAFRVPIRMLNMARI